MASEKQDELKAEEDNRTPWERPALRRLYTERAEHAGFCQDEGNTMCDNNKLASFQAP